MNLILICSKIVIFPGNNSAQNLSSVTLKTKDLEGVGGKHPGMIPAKNLGMNRVGTIIPETEYAAATSIYHGLANTKNRGFEIF